MKLRTYRARSMAEALAAVRRDFGSSAVILRTQQRSIGGILGFGSRMVFEVTASAGDRAAEKPATSRPIASASALRAYGGSAAAREEPSRETLREAPRELPPEPEPAAAEPTGALLGEVVRASRAALLAPELERDIASIKRMVRRMVESAPAGRGSPAAGPGPMGDALFDHYLRLVEHEVAGEIADEIVGRARDELSPGEMADPTIVRETVLRHLAAMIPTDSSIPPPARADDRPLTIALVGPTGVGKTTTVAKLAAAFKLRHGRRVGLITSDTYRIAAVEQLRTYAEIIALPLRVVMTPTEMASASESLAGSDVVLIDTAGRSPADEGRLDELRRFIEAARPHQTHLVLSSTASEAALMAAAERFAVVGPNRVIFTKLDEAVNFGVLVTVARRLELALSYVTTGQEVPEHIEVGRADRLARLVVDGGGGRAR